MADRDLRQQWGERLAEHRNQRGLSQADLAERIGTSQQAVSRWESGRHSPPDSARIELARLFGTTVARLFPYGDEDTESLPEHEQEKSA